MVDQNALDVIKAGAKRLEWIGKLAAELERIGSIEQAAQEAVRQREQAEAKAAEAQARVDELRARIDETQQTIDREIVAMREHCDGERKRTEIQCGELLRAAGVEAARLKAEGAAEARKEKEAAEAFRRRTASEAAAAQNAASLAVAERNAAAQELTDLQARIAAAREQARKIIG